MSRHTFRVPDIGEGTAEVELVKWYVSPDDVVVEDQIVAELMTEKASVETPSPVAGRVLALHGAVGDMLAVGSPLVEFDIQASGAEDTADGSPALTFASMPVIDDVATLPLSAACPRAEKPLASPSVRAKAGAVGVLLHSVAGSGPDGRITHEDLDAHVANQAGVPAVNPDTSSKQPNPSITDVPVIGLRRRIAQQMQESKRRIPHFSYIEEVDVTELDEFRQYLNETRQQPQAKLTLLPFLIRAITTTLPAFPQINARFDDESGIVHRYGGVHLGIATQTPNGLIVPVIRHAETLGLWELAREITRLAAATRAGTAKREELTGSTITITSLGPLGGIAHTPVINHPEVAIIGPNKIHEKVVVRAGGFVTRKVMNISSSFDHRVVDGWDAAEFIQKVRAFLERPILLFTDRSS